MDSVALRVLQNYLEHWRESRTKKKVAMSGVGDYVACITAIENVKYWEHEVCSYFDLQYLDTTIEDELVADNELVITIRVKEK